MTLTRRTLLGASLIVPAAGASLALLRPGPAAGAKRTAPWTLIPPEKERTFSIDGQPAAGIAIPGNPVSIPPGAREAHIRLTYDQPEILHTAFLEAGVADMGAGINPSNVDVPQSYLVWRPGDDRDLWLTLKIKQDTADGDRFMVYFKPFGFSKAGAVIVQVEQGANNALPAVMPKHRPARRLAVPDKPAVELDVAAMKWSDSGYVGNARSGTPCWRSRLPHGYTQPANGENGIYANTDKFPNEAVAPQTIEKDAAGRDVLRLHSMRYEKPVAFEGASYPFQASVLQAQRLDEWCHRRGVYEADIATPSQKGAWSAFWLVGRNAAGKPMWPPEIDCFESFNGAYGAGYTQYSTSSGQHVGMHGSNKREAKFGIQPELDKLGFDPSLNLNTAPHTYSCEVTDEWITHFIDRTETIMYRNMTDAADGRTDWTFFPIVNVAVRAEEGGEYSQGTSSDLLLYGMRYYSS